MPFLFLAEFFAGIVFGIVAGLAESQGIRPPTMVVNRE